LSQYVPFFSLSLKIEISKSLIQAGKKLATNVHNSKSHNKRNTIKPINRGSSLLNTLMKTSMSTHIESPDGRTKREVDRSSNRSNNNHHHRHRNNGRNESTEVKKSKSDYESSNRWGETRKWSKGKGKGKGGSVKYAHSSSYDQPHHDVADKPEHFQPLPPTSTKPPTDQYRSPRGSSHQISPPAAETKHPLSRRELFKNWHGKTIQAFKFISFLLFSLLFFSWE
jgi:hypothetical protein